MLPLKYLVVVSGKPKLHRLSRLSPLNNENILFFNRQTGSTGNGLSPKTVW
jgi:hypothetical protein